ncbi:hypothetical protein LguiA_025537 [Lonicera macranthoides]
MGTQCWLDCVTNTPDKIENVWKDVLSIVLDPTLPSTMELLDSVQPNTPSWDEATQKQKLNASTTNHLNCKRYENLLKTLEFNCNWFQGLERFIDETDVDENAFAVLEFRFGFTRTLKISWHNNYWCDPNLIEHNLKEVEGSQHGFYVNMVIKAFMFFPEELPKMRRTLKATPIDFRPVALTTKRNSVFKDNVPLHNNRVVVKKEKDKQVTMLFKERHLEKLSLEAYLEDFLEENKLSQKPFCRVELVLRYFVVEAISPWSYKLLCDDKREIGPVPVTRKQSGLSIDTMKKWAAHCPKGRAKRWALYIWD